MSRAIRDRDVVGGRGGGESSFEVRQRIPETLFEAAGLAASVPRTAARPVRRVGSGIDLRGAPAWFSVLGSSSSGNCSVLKVGAGENYRLILIDAGLSPRRTRQLLGELGLDADRIAAVVLTHLHRDHYKDTWAKKLPRDAWFWVHRRHRSAAKRAGVLYRKTELFDDDAFDVLGVRIEGRLAPHDEAGSVVFRFEVEGGAWPADEAGTPRNGRWASVDGVATEPPVRSLGYATDLGCVRDEVEDLLAGVDVLAIESNYCDAMQLDSGRHRFLIDRIMQDGGHLSNEQCAEACARLGPREAVVLLHLSRQCNTPARALEYHTSVGYAAYAAPEIGPMRLMTFGATETAGCDEGG